MTVMDWSIREPYVWGVIISFAAMVSVLVFLWANGDNRD